MEVGVAAALGLRAVSIEVAAAAAAGCVGAEPAAAIAPTIFDDGSELHLPGFHPSLSVDVNPACASPP